MRASTKKLPSILNAHSNKNLSTFSTKNRMPPDVSSFKDVISLITVDDGDCLDPAQSESLISNVTIRKREITFPFSIAHDRPAFAAELKEKKICENMLNRDRIKNFFKCMAFRCMFSSSSAKDFMDHLHWHNKQYLSL